MKKNFFQDQNRKSQKSIAKNNGGFTLVELVVVLVIMGILLSISVMGMMAWQDFSEFNKQNEYAQTLFMAAQNQLQEYSSNGVLDEFSEQLKGEDDQYLRRLDPETLTDGEGNLYALDDVWYEANGKEDKTKYRGTLVYASSKAGDYAAYQDGSLESGTGAEIVFRLLESYVYDTSLLNQSISVEFTPADGQVFSVCYSDKVSRFFYGSESVNDGKESVSINNRELSYRRERMVGYYGVDTLAKATSARSARPVLSNVKLLNEDTLNLSFKVNRYPEALQRLRYTVDVCDRDDHRVLLRVLVDGSKVHNFERRTAVACPVTRYDYDAGGAQTAVDLEEYSVLCYIDGAGAMHIVLDAVDLKASSERYLDALSAGLGRGNAASEHAQAIASTYSFHRFGLDAENIYCKVKGSGSDYRATSEKKSNSESAYFAETRRKETGGKVAYTNRINNVRHLYNIRYLEDCGWADVNRFSGKLDTDSFTVEFPVEEDLDWKDFLDAGSVYLSGADPAVYPGSFEEITGASAASKVRFATDAKFPSVGQLRHGDKIYGTTGLLRTGSALFDRFETDREANEAFGVYENTNIVLPGSADAPVGLFVHNYGRMNNLKMDRVKADGIDKTGAFCGTNAGDLADLEILNTDFASVVSGETNVGGIMGYLETVNDAVLNGSGEATPLELTRMTNRAKIRGSLYVGGIVGQICLPEGAGATPRVTVSKSYNYGVLEPVSATGGNDPAGARYIGGITGFLDNKYKNALGEQDPELLVIEDCTSSPEYSGEDLRRMLENSVENAAAKLENRLLGVYVGGIVGYNYYSTVRNCDTKAEKGKTGYIFGYQYVGGIVGFNQGPASGIKGGGVGYSGENQANVVGWRYVGGITGCNADVLEDTDVVVPDPARNPQVKIENWINEGIIFATDSYAGGITGYNAGWIFHCDSQVDANSSAQFSQTTYSGDYVGGITGYNNGIIGNTFRDETKNYAISDTRSEGSRRIPAVCYIIGENYVGGIVGYNDVDAIVEDYEIAGGYILGDRDNSFFVGGYAGFNASAHLLVSDDMTSPHNIVSNPNRVTGKYFVGGSVGANIINTRSLSVPGGRFNGVFKTDNFLGTLNATEFAGGFIGYNLFVDEDEHDPLVAAADSNNISGAIQKKLVDRFVKSDASSSEKAKKLEEKLEILYHVTASDKTLGKKCKASDITLHISGSNEAQTENTLGMITADIYVGGVIGYNDDETKIYIRNVKNTTPIVSNYNIARAAEQPGRTTDYIGEDKEYRYSYAGGIIGRVGRNTIIDNCENSSSGTVDSSGTYTGGIAEVNAGVIRNCKVATFGSSVVEYAGAVCGLNAKSGLVEDCTISDKTITGKNMVGSVAAENFGTIRNISVDKIRINISGKTVTLSDGTREVHGVTGIYAAYNAGTIETDGTLEGVNINTKGNYAGAVCGINNGIVKNDSGNLVVKGNIIGRRSVGGIIGLNDSEETSTMQKYENRATITAHQGDAGGIVGTNRSNNTIKDCRNKGVVTATQAGNAAGITAINASTIENCTDYAKILAPNGMGSGIVAVNKEGALIKNCTVKPESGAAALVFSSMETTGGICSENYGTRNRIFKRFAENFSANRFFCFFSLFMI